MKLEMECKILAGAESKAWLVEFSRQVDRLEKMAGGFKASQTAKPADEAEEETESEEDFTTTAADEGEEETEGGDDDFTSAPAKKKPGRPAGSKNKAKASFDEDDEGAEEETETEESDAIDMAEMKKGKTKKITLDMINDAAKALAKSKGKQGRAHVLGLLKKHFKTESISDIDEADYPKALKVLAV